MNLQKFTLKLIYLAGVCLFATFSVTALGFAADDDAPEPEDDSGKMTLASVAKKSDGFEYQLEGRRDPFEPFIKPKIATTFEEKKEIIVEEVVLTGMQLFEPGQLKLVAIISAKERKIAMVEDVTGKGYVINEGVLIGRHGKVSQITPNKVIITETARTRAGKELTTTVVMRLKE